jgi:hypothetical protein
MSLMAQQHQTRDSCRSRVLMEVNLAPGMEWFQFRGLGNWAFKWTWPANSLYYGPGEQLTGVKLVGDCR